VLQVQPDWQPPACVPHWRVMPQLSTAVPQSRPAHGSEDGVQHTCTVGRVSHSCATEQPQLTELPQLSSCVPHFPPLHAIPFGTQSHCFVV
jgi:hypothetical protein